MSKHTAGPWSIHPKAHLVVIGAAGHLVASCSGYTNNQVCQEDLEAEQTSNMHLVAAAPDLLEAIENLLWHAEQLEELIESERGKGRSSEQLYASGEMHAYMVEAKSCIAKARGEA